MTKEFYEAEIKTCDSQIEYILSLVEAGQLSWSSAEEMSIVPRTEKHYYLEQLNKLQ